MAARVVQPYDVIRALSGNAVATAFDVLADNAADHWEVPNNGRVLLGFKNVQSGSLTATVRTTAKVDGLDVADRTFTVPETLSAAGSRFYGPFPVEQYGETLHVSVNGASLELVALRF